MTLFEHGGWTMTSGSPFHPQPFYVYMILSKSHTKERLLLNWRKKEMQEHGKPRDDKDE